MADAPNRLNRRTALKGLTAAALGPALASAGCDPAGGDPDPTPDPPLQDGSPADVIDTVVILMMENRSFDHYFGALSLVEGRTDVDGLTAEMSNPRPDGGTESPHPADANCVLDPPHGWSSSHDQFNDGANDGFVSEHYDRWGADEAHRVMGYFDRDKLSALYAMADQHVLCQRWFCSLMSSTWPNRFYSHAAQNGGAYGNDFPAQPFPSIYPRLEEAGVSWGGYYSNAPFLFLLPDVLPGENIKPLEDFFWDARLGILPSVTIVEPIYGRNDDHPPAHPVAGQILINSVYQALAESPHWERCVLIVTYDEHGGFFDHVPPPTAADDRAADGFDQLGFRVPTVVCGPWTKQGHVSDTVFDHTSILAFLERLHGIEPLTARDAAAADLFELFDGQRIARREPLAPATLPEIVADEAEILAPECVTVRDGASCVTGQPELEAVMDELLVGTRFDRRTQTDALYAEFLEMARARGIWRPSGA